MEHSVSIPFPPVWALLPTGAESTAMIEALSSGLARLGVEVQRNTEAYLKGLSEFLGVIGVDLFGSMVVPCEETNQSALAWCAIGVADAQVSAPEQLQELAADDPFGQLDDADLSIIDGRAGPIGRSRHFRANLLWQDVDGYWPYSATVRYVLALDPEHVLICHFETISLAYLDVLEEHFDSLVSEVNVS